MNWLARLRAWHEARTVARFAIADPLWAAVERHYPFIGQRSAADRAELRRLVSLFLARKEFSGAHGLVVTDAMAVAIAAQACLPVLHLGLSAYDGFVGIVVHPGAAVARREVRDEAGLVHQYDEPLAGEAMAGGPVMLNWPDVAAAGASAANGYNVVIHEFVHVLDMAHGLADGYPVALPAAQRARWAQVMRRSYGRLRHMVNAGVEPWLDAYGAQAPEEFFAVAAESFFVSPHTLRHHDEALYEVLADYFQQDPAAVLTYAV
ncbi:MAG: zinc-dependent peptidase [Proteobacteria bacterium]|nr:zinc-dependent peptidase [Pseudomonadota bacterium]